MKKRPKTKLEISFDSIKRWYGPTRRGKQTAIKSAGEPALCRLRNRSIS
jgi:hypothetical protein